MNRWKLGAVAALVAGLALTIGMALHVGLGALVKSVDTIGWGGFLVYGLANILVFFPLGASWWSLAPGGGSSKVLAFIWGRLLREAASDVLPLAQVGGLVVGVRAVGQRGVAEGLVVGSLIVDLTTEMAAQLVYTLFGVAVVLAGVTHASGARTVVSSALVALAVGAGVLALFVAFQGRTVDLAAHLSSRWLKDTRARADAVRAVLADTYAQPLRLACSFLLHCFSWAASGGCSWLALRFMGAHLGLVHVLALESLMAAVRSVAFMTPGGLGVQESAYVLAAPLFGLSPGSALALSLLKRAKDLCIGIPALLSWQASEGRKLAQRA